MHTDSRALCVAQVPIRLPRGVAALAAGAAAAVRASLEQMSIALMNFAYVLDELRICTDCISSNTFAHDQVRVPLCGMGAARRKRRRRAGRRGRWCAA